MRLPMVGIRLAAVDGMEHVAGYVAHYGSACATMHNGNGGEAIYQADKAHLEHLRSRLAAVRGGIR